ncbi:DNA/RNA non-specific endonuclease [Lacticaseibacillus jixianensis]|uniref:DNA/RNA non-specific endonuclease n=1 Tax=Lacticaseibacillus jixianensis TaxID=2486012 RepID=A0ABW4BA67_9LACO|nr:DNA/RNA non-specific endonuclease [Lacticaseibacillus jixianensis]
MVTHQLHHRPWRRVAKAAATLALALGIGTAGGTDLAAASPVAQVQAATRAPRVLTASQRKAAATKAAAAKKAALAKQAAAKKAALAKQAAAKQAAARKAALAKQAAAKKAAARKAELAKQAAAKKAAARKAELAKQAAAKQAAARKAALAKQAAAKQAAARKAALAKQAAAKQAAARKAALAKQAAAKRAAAAKAAAQKQAKAEQSLAYLKYHGAQTVNVNGGKPTFTTADLSTKRGSWQRFANLDALNRAVDAEALMNKAMMPTAKRQELTWDPTGWHNKKLKSGYLYNRSHLIGYQLTGQNNNPKNLITGTRSLNSPAMLRYEDDIAYFMKKNPRAYVRYSVRPLYQGKNRLAAGVHMMALGVGARGVSFNVYIFNVEAGVKINYADGTSVVSAAETIPAKPAPKPKPATKPAAKPKPHSTSKPKAKPAPARGKTNTAATRRIIGNRKSKIYHVPGQAGYKMSSSNAVYFATEQQARAAGYRRAKR